MATLQELPADQRAVLGLLLRQGRSYSQIAGVLRLEERAVRERALDAMDALGTQDDALSAEDQDLVADYLLGQADGPAREEAQALLDESPPARAWAHAVAGELAGLAPAGSLPELPGEPSSASEPEPTPAPEPEPAEADPTPPAPAAPAAATPVATEAEAASPPPDAPAPAAAAATTPRSRSRTAGTALIIGAAVVAVIGIVIALSGGFGGGDDDPSTDAPVAAATATTPATPTSTGTSTTARVDQQIELTPSNRGSSALGIVQLSTQDGRRGLAAVAQDLSPGYYAVWFYNSASDEAFVGFGNPVSADGDQAGRFGARGLIGTDVDVSRYRSVLISRQTVTSQNYRTRPTKPGTIVLRGSLR